MDFSVKSILREKSDYKTRNLMLRRNRYDVFNQGWPSTKPLNVAFHRDLQSKWPF